MIAGLILAVTPAFGNENWMEDADFASLPTLTASQAAAQDPCSDPSARAEIVYDAATTDRVRSAALARELYRAEIAREGSPLQGMTPALAAYIEENYDRGADVVKALDILKTFDYNHFIPVFKRYNQVDLPDDEFRERLNAGGAMGAAGLLAKGYIQRLDDLLQKLNPEETRRKQEIFAHLDTVSCHRILSSRWRSS